MKEPIIGIVAGLVGEIMPNNELLSRTAAPRSYSDAIDLAGGIPILIPIVKNENIEKQLSICDGFIFTGGMDINPIIYNEEPHQNLGAFSTELDRYQYRFIEKVIQSKKPFLAICRGFQMLNVVTGGTLYQDLSEIDSVKLLQHTQKGLGKDPAHSVIIEKESCLYNIFGNKALVNSYHHQSIKSLGRGLKAVAKAKDGIIEGVELEGRKFGIGVQWHPETMVLSDNKMLKLFELLIEYSK